MMLPAHTKGSNTSHIHTGNVFEFNIHISNVKTINTITATSATN